MQAGLRQPQIQKFACYNQQITKAEPKEFTGGDQLFFLLGSERGQQVVAGMRSIVDIAVVAPTPDGRVGDSILASQLTITDAGGRCLDLGTVLWRGGGLLMHLDVHEPAPG